MTCREYAKKNGFSVVGKLRRMPDHLDMFCGETFPWFMDEAENEYHMDRDEAGRWFCFCIVTADNGVI